MFYFKLDAELEVVEIANAMPAELKVVNGPWYRRGDGSYGPGGWINRNDIDSFMFAEQIADSASRLGGPGGVYIAVDKGPRCSPRFDVIEAPSYNAECSMAFNGDSYPVGKIQSISIGYKLIVVDGPRGKLVFRRQDNSGSWINRGFSLIPGVVNKLNPEF